MTSNDTKLINVQKVWNFKISLLDLLDSIDLRFLQNGGNHSVGSLVMMIVVVVCTVYRSCNNIARCLICLHACLPLTPKKSSYGCLLYNFLVDYKRHWLTWQRNLYTPFFEKEKSLTSWWFRRILSQSITKSLGTVNHFLNYFLVHQSR